MHVIILLKSKPLFHSIIYLLVLLRVHSSKNFPNLNFPPKQKKNILQKKLVIQTSPSDSHPPDQQRSGIFGKSGQNKPPVLANGEGRCNSFLKILNCDTLVLLAF